MNNETNHSSISTNTNPADFSGASLPKPAKVRAAKPAKAEKAKAPAKPAKPAQADKMPAGAVDKSKPAKAEKKAKAAPAKAEKRLDTGFVASIRSKMNSGRFTISQMAEEVLSEFPGKDLASIKRIGHNLAKRARMADPTTKAKWLPGAPASTGYMARIDELLRQGKLTTRQVGETVAAEFKKDVVSAKKVIRARLKRLLKKGEKFTVPLESSIAKPAKEKAPKAPKAEAAPAPAKGKAKKETKAEKIVRESLPAKKAAKVSKKK